MTTLFCDLGRVILNTMLNLDDFGAFVKLSSTKQVIFFFATSNFRHFKNITQKCNHLMLQVVSSYFDVGLIVISSAKQLLLCRCPCCDGESNEKRQN